MSLFLVCGPHRAVYPKKWNPVLPGRCSPGDFTAPSISQPVGTSQPKQTGGGLQTIALLQTPLINCRSQSSGYHALSRIKFKIKYPRVTMFVCTHGYVGVKRIFNLKSKFQTKLSFPLAFTVNQMHLFKKLINIRINKSNFHWSVP